jgi:hypothetical protein
MHDQFGAGGQGGTLSTHRGYSEYSQGYSEYSQVFMHDQFGAGGMKKAKCSPDSFVQLAMQVGALVAVYVMMCAVRV